jgi:acyl-homoserine-lactone acylase
MRHLALAVSAAASVACGPPAPANPDAARWRQAAESVTITRDDWGVPHIHGKTDADTVFGVIYAQAEDDFNRVETNYLNAMGRLAEAEGERAVVRDLRMKLFIDPADLQAQYEKSPEWLKRLMRGWADALNYYLATHPRVSPRVITKFEPWMVLSFSEGSIGGDIESVRLDELGAFYGAPPASVASATSASVREPGGSSAFAIAPANTASKHALLWINPHTSFFFREELQATSDEGLNAYGAATWGQFFIYQGFNEKAGWMHTSSNVDCIDEYAETVTKQGDRYTYRYGSEERPLSAASISVAYRTAGGMARKEFTVYRTHHGPVVREAGGKWITVRLMHEPMKALMQSYSRTKARNYKEFRQSLDMHTNSSNNTVFADAEGTIAYLHANFIPRRSTKFDWSKPVDGSDPETEWGGPLSIDESPSAVNPSSGWVFNTNNAPWSAAGRDSPKQRDFPAYVDSGEENPRGVHAIRVLSAKKDFTMDSVRDAGFDSYLPELAVLIPTLVRAWDRTPAADPLKAKLADPIAQLRAWDFRWSVSSVPTTLAVYWGEQLGRDVKADPELEALSAYAFMETRASSQQRLGALATAVDALAADFGTWRVPWGELNRFQRLTGAIVQPFSDDAPSIPVGFTSSRWGSLAAFEARRYPNTRKRYGTSGNSFVAVVEFGEAVRAKAVTAGGLSSDPSSPHFNDQGQRYATGALRDVYFYPAQLQGHSGAPYHPGQ